LIAITYPGVDINTVRKDIIPNPESPVDFVGILIRLHQPIALDVPSRREASESQERHTRCDGIRVIEPVDILLLQDRIDLCTIHSGLLR
jgi:hypothetical protein